MKRDYGFLIHRRVTAKFNHGQKSNRAGKDNATILFLTYIRKI